MRIYKIIAFISFFFFSSLLYPTTHNHSATFARIHPKDVRKLLLYASLYPETKEGKQALDQAWTVLAGEKQSTPLPADFAHIALSFLSLIEPVNTPSVLPPETITCINALCSHLPNRQLKGRSVKSIDEVLALDDSEIDLSTALLLAEPNRESIEASLDLLALQIHGQNAHEKISAINNLLFHELNIKYPALSEAEERVSEFSELSSVFSSRRGICLGTSVLYLALAQRVGLNLTVFTPPGHVFVGYKEHGNTRVIETTALGTHIPLKHYLGPNLHNVPTQSLKQVVGMAAFNQGGQCLRNGDYNIAQEKYDLAYRFSPNDGTGMMRSLCLLLRGKTRESQKLAYYWLCNLAPEKREPDLLLVDLATGNLSQESAQQIVKLSSTKKENLLESIKKLEIMHTSNSWTIPMQLAEWWLNLGKPREALSLLEKLTARKEAQASIHFLLASLYRERMNYPKAWEQATLAIQKSVQPYPKPLYDLLIELQKESPTNIDPGLPIPL